jgi:Acetyltransferase (GNAT) domain
MIGSTLQQNATIVRVASPTDSLWQDFLDTVPHDFYHLPGYLKLEAKRYNAIPEAMMIREGEKVFFLPYLVRDCSHILDPNDREIERIYDVISPYGYPGMIVNQAGQNPTFITKCLELIADCWQSRNICAAFIRLHPILNSYLDNSSSNRKFVFCEQGDVVTCDLTKDLRDICQQIRSNHRRKIDKLTRAGFIVKIGSIAEYLDIFIEIYQETMDRVQATDAYYFTRDYFESLSQILGDRIAICVVEIDGQVVAASLITELSGIIQYHLGGTRTAFLRQSPATIMFKYIIEWAKQRDNKYLNLGGGLGGSHDSLYHFKSGFSDEFKPFTTIKTVVDRENYTRLIHARANFLGVSATELENTSFFPAYRSA